MPARCELTLLETDVAPRRTSKNPQHDFGRRGGSIHLAHDPPVPLFCKEPEFPESRGPVHGCRGAEASGEDNRLNSQFAYAASGEG
jgi:hypothetical protein